jgi:ribosomal 30S subunit maturation factor RimM
MGADTLMGNDVYNRQDEDLGDIKEIMLNVADDVTCVRPCSKKCSMGNADPCYIISSTEAKKRSSPNTS